MVLGYASSSGDESARVRAGGDDSEFSEIDDFSFGPNMAAALLASSSPASATRNNQNYYLNNQHPASQGTTDTANRQQYSSTESNSLVRHVRDVVNKWIANCSKRKLVAVISILLFV